MYTTFLLTIFALPPQAPDAPMPPQAPALAPCALAGCGCGCADGGPCCCRAAPAAASPPLKETTYAEWKANAHARRASRPTLALAPAVHFAPASATFHPALMFRPAPILRGLAVPMGRSGGGACRGGG